MQRLFKMEEQGYIDKIKQLNAQMEIEKEVSAKIRDYFTAKNATLQKQADDVEIKKDNKLRELSSEKHKIEDDKAAAEQEIVIVRQKCEKEYMDKKRQEELDREEEEKERQKIRDKMAMEAAANYIQRRWAWFQDEGRALAKKRKKGGGKGKKKKKKWVH